MALKFNCPGCNSEIVVKYLKIGERAKCWSCGAEAVVPENATEGSFAKATQRPSVSSTTAEPVSKAEQEVERIRRSFSCGAFFLAPVWLLFHGRVGTGILVMLLILFLRGVADLWGAANVVAVFIQLLIALYFGERGNEIAAKHRCYASLEELKRKEKGWTIAGLVVGIVGVVLAVIAYAPLITYYSR